MNRRKFLELMGVSAASVSVSGALIALPEVEPKMLLLEEKKIILPGDNDFVLSKADFVIENIVSIQYHREEHLLVHDQGSFGVPVFSPGQLKIDIDVTFYTPDGFNFINPEPSK